MIESNAESPERAPARAMLRGRDLAQVASRTSYLQALFTPERMQGPGFAFALLPVLRRLYPRTEERGRALERHVGYFNTHPVLVGYVLGAVARLEERRASGEDVDGARIDELKRGLASPLAAWGDPLFWVTLRPLAGLVGVLGLPLLPSGGAGEPDPRVLLCPLLVLLTYNALALPFRAAGVARGYELADRPVELIRSLRLSEWHPFLERAGAIAFGALLMLTLAGLERSARRFGLSAAGPMLLAPLALGAAVAWIGLRRWPGRGLEIALASVLLAGLLASRI